MDNDNDDDDDDDNVLCVTAIDDLGNINPENCILCLLCSIAAPQNRCMKTWRHPQNRKYITYRNASRGEPSQGQFFSKVAANSVIAISQLERYAISSDVSNSLRWASI